MTQVFHALVAMNALFAAATWTLARPTTLSIAAVFVASFGWLFLNGPLEGHVLLVLTPQHGVTESDLLSVVGVGIGVVGTLRRLRTGRTSSHGSAPGVA